ncbi:MAG: DivIVA domain-containing protein [Eubacteriales bacterium]
MITPNDIQNKQFSKVVRGYKEEEVDGFLDLLTLDYNKVLKDNQELKEQVKIMNAEMERYKNSQETVYETLEAAKKLMSDISESAEKRASMVLKNAELDAQIIIREAKESVEKLSEEYASIKSRLNIFKTRYKTLLESELEKFDILSSDIFSDKDLEDLKSLTGDGRKNTILVDKRAVDSTDKIEARKKDTNKMKFGDGLL